VDFLPSLTVKVEGLVDGEVFVFSVHPVLEAIADSSVFDVCSDFEESFWSHSFHRLFP
jgi:hypothetical protein